MTKEDTDNLIPDLADLAKLVSPVKGEIGRLGTLYPGESTKHFPPEPEMTEDNEAPSTDEESAEHNKRTAHELSPRSLSPEGRAWLATAMPPERIKRLNQIAIERL